jgi:glyoxylase-like metal-dependent hydrolase (beta-lactamase superfamily II)
MTAFICKTCGVQHAPSARPPDRCIICEDERQYVPPRGQQWTTLEEMRDQAYQNRFRELEPGLHSVNTRPAFGIGQRALLVQTSRGNFLWDCVTFIDEATVDHVRSLGGLAGIAVSHPHFYGSMVEWSHAFGGVPVYIAQADREWVVRQNGAVEWYEGALEVWPGLTLVQCGGHFEGSAVLHWADGADGRGVLLGGDTISVTQDRRFVTFMRSYPNYIPLPEAAVRRIVDAIRAYEFERIYGPWLEMNSGAKRAVERSAERYIRYIRD